MRSFLALTCAAALATAAELARTGLGSLIPLTGLALIGVALALVQSRIGPH